LTNTRTIETGVKHLFWDKRAEWTFSAFDIERNNVYQSKSGHLVNIAGQIHAQGIEFASAIRPTDQWKLFANIALVQSKYDNFVDAFTGEDFSGKTPPNVPRIIVNAGASYRLPLWVPVEIGASVRHVGARFNNDDNLVTMNAYTTADAFVFFDIERAQFPALYADKTRIAFRVRNLTDKRYAAWGDPGYPDQVILGAPRSYEVSANFKF
jgi:iron complex outermembrane receptor protein